MVARAGCKPAWVVLVLAVSICGCKNGSESKKSDESAKPPVQEAGGAEKQSSQPQGASESSEHFRIVSETGETILAQDDLVRYDWATHTMTLKPGTVERIEAELKGRLVSGAPFRIEADGVICYEGVFTTSMSSISQSGVVIDVAPIDNILRPMKELSITLGYPTEEFFRGTDPRGDARIKKALTALGKLQEAEE